MGQGEHLKLGHCGLGLPHSGMSQSLYEISDQTTGEGLSSRTSDDFLQHLVRLIFLDPSLLTY